MRCWKSVAKVFLLGAVALGVVSCGAATQQQQPETSQASAEPIEDSGKRLSGEFLLSALEDTYRPKNSSGPQTVFSFDESGNFKRQDKSRIEEGGYVISTRGELVFYIEKVNGEPLTDARVERYVITDQRDDAITLQSGPSRKLVLRKRRAVGASLCGRPSSRLKRTQPE